MTAVPIEFTEVRVLLGRFETEMHRPEGLVHLSKALSLLADIQTDDESEKTRQNLLALYAEKVQEQVELLLAREPSVHWEIVEHWQTVFGEFERSGFALSQDIAETLSRLAMRKMNREIALLSRSERQELLARLQRSIRGQSNHSFCVADDLNWRWRAGQSVW